MLYSKSINRLPFLKISFLLFFALIVGQVGAQTLVIKGEIKSAIRKASSVGQVGVANVKTKEEPLEGAKIEIKKNGATLATATSDKKGKYTIEVTVSAADAKNDYVGYITKPGMGPKTFAINAYVPKAEFAKYPGPKYNAELNMSLMATTVADVEPDKPIAKIKWDLAKEHTFVWDPTTERQVESEDSKILADPDKYYAALAKKQKAKANKIDLVALKKEADKRKADSLAAVAEAKRLADIQAKADLVKKAQQRKADSLAAILQAQRKADSLKEVARQKALAAANAATNTTIPTEADVIEVIQPAMMQASETVGGYDAAEKYSISVARKSLSMAKELRSREKSKNLSAKYETINVLTSLLNMVDEHDKMARKQ